MKAMIMSDLLIAKKYLFQQLGTAVVVGVFICIIVGNLYVVPPAVGVMVPFSLTIMILTLDERANWQQFRLALPISRGDVIRGRYVSFLVFALCGLAVGLLIAFLIIIAVQVAPTVPQLANLMANFAWQGLLMVSVAGISVILIMLSITMPVFSRFGMTKGVRYLPLLVIFGVFIVFSLKGNGPPSAFILDVLNLLETPSGTIAVAVGILAIVAVVYIVSAILSVKLYKRREL